MKRMIISNKLPKHIDVVVEISLFDPDGRIAASREVPDLPKGELMPAEKDVLIGSQVLEDYHAFIDSIEDLITDYYDLHIFYKNDSPDNSYYFGMLAKDDKGNILLDFDFTLRVSTHDPKRSEMSQKHKKEKKDKLLKTTGGKKTRPIRKYLTVNDVEFDSYEEAYLEVDKKIAAVVKVMKRRSK